MGKQEVFTACPDHPSGGSNRKTKRSVCKRIAGILAIGLLAVGANAQQDAQYSQYMFNHLALNPAYAGTKDALCLTLLNRNQWVAMEDGAPHTSSLSLHGPLRSKKIGLGIEFISDNLGPHRMGGVMTSYSYNIHLLSGKLSFGLRTGFYKYVTDWTRIHYKDQADPYAQLTETESKGVLSADFGMYYYTKSFYWGVSADHLNHDKYSVFGPDPQFLAMHIYSPIGIGFQVTDNLVINPSVLVKYVKGAPVAFDANCNFLIENRLWLGASFRKGYGVAALMMWHITEKFKLGLSYDHGVNRIGVLGKASFEAMIGYNFNVSKTKTITPRYL
jgi:type IX secretion system PorP/SprF family membrane protein